MHDSSPISIYWKSVSRSCCLSVVVLLLTILGVPALPAAPEATDVTGTWDLTVEMQGGTAHPSITLKQEGEKITGTYQGQMGKSNLEGIIKGDDIRFAVTLKFQDVTYTVTYAGTIDGDTMKGTARFGDAGSGTWSAKRRRNHA
jgi:hypothetical protein